MRNTVLLAFGVGLIAAAVWASRIPEPSAFPVSWQLDFENAIPKRIVVAAPNQTTPTAYWYMTYTVTNRSGEERQFLPAFDLLSEEGKLIRSDQNIPLAVFQRIRQVEGKKFLEQQNQLTGVVRLGEDQARDGVAIWPEPKPEMGKFTIFVAGLSGEEIALERKDGAYVRVTSMEGLSAEQRAALQILRKTLQLKFFVNGDEVYPGEDETNTGARVWIMR